MQTRNRAGYASRKRAARRSARLGFSSPGAMRRFGFRQGTVPAGGSYAGEHVVDGVHVVVATDPTVTTDPTDYDRLDKDGRAKLASIRRGAKREAAAMTDAHYLPREAPPMSADGASTTARADDGAATDRNKRGKRARYLRAYARGAMSTGNRSAVTGDTGEGSRNVGRQRNAPRPVSSAGDHGSARPASSVPVHSGPVRTSAPTGPATTRDRVDVRAADQSFSQSCTMFGIAEHEATACGGSRRLTLARHDWLRWLRSPGRLARVSRSR